MIGTFGRLACLLSTISSTASAQGAPPDLLPVFPRSLTAPVTPACISSPFGPRRLVGPRAATFHNGIDFPAPAGAPVRTVAAGTVIAIRRIGAEGLAIDVEHLGPGGPYVTRSAHLGTVTPALAEGRRTVAAGEVLGRVGRTGITYGTHVHFELHVGGKPIDPEPAFDTPRCKADATTASRNTITD